MSYIYDWKKEIKQKELDECINIIKKGGIIIFPTDTVYGIGCSAFCEDSIKKIFKIKNRNYNKPINVLCSSIEDVKKLALKLNTKQEKIINKYMPGACTLIVKKKTEISKILTANLDTVGVRIPNNNIALELITKSGVPMATTSANISGQNDSIQIKEILTEFKDKVDVIIDGGKAKIGIPSTIVEIANNKINILRQGSLIIS